MIHLAEKRVVFVEELEEIVDEDGVAMPCSITHGDKRDTDWSSMGSIKMDRYPLGEEQRDAIEGDSLKWEQAYFC